MNSKPIYLIPFIVVYKIVSFFITIVINFCKYYYKGIKRIFILTIKGFFSVCVVFYQLPKMMIQASAKREKKTKVPKEETIEQIEPSELITEQQLQEEYLTEINPEEVPSITEVIPEEEQPLMEVIPEAVKEITAIETPEIIETIQLSTEEIKNLRKLRQKEQKRLKTSSLKMQETLEEKKKKREKVKTTKIEKKKKTTDAYINDKVKIEKPSFFANVGEYLAKINHIPKSIKAKFNNNDFIKNRRNQELMKREALLINFDGDDAEKSDVKILYEYVAKNPEGKVVKDYFEAFSKVEVHSFLLSEGFEVYSIRTNRWIQLMHKNANMNNTKIKVKDLIFFITQLSTYIKAGIPLVEALRILERQYKNKKYKKIFKSVIYDLTMGENFSEALLKQNVAFPRLLINMIKTAEMTGELPEVLDDMAEYYTESERTRKQMITALMYPSLVFVFATGVIIFILIYVVPQFVEIYESMDADKIPTFTLLVISVSNFLKSYALYVLLGLVLVVFLMIYMYKNIKFFRTICQYIMMKLPFIGNTIIYNEVTMFTKTFSSLLSHNVFITESMEVLNKITNNEIYKMLIFDTLTNLSKGDKISSAYKDHWAFPIPAYEMLVTGEKTGELPEMMSKVSTYYQELHKDSVTRIKTFIEPALTVFLTVVVGIIIMAIIIPMFGMYETIQTY